ncbi:phage portal protein [Falsiroseomonas sp. CW058]|uniref:phage portal protein n=1 Tax=Falsiroseomonas sp. CW058 TaxID=3388664 RepID=UPI003D31E5DD
MPPSGGKETAIPQGVADRISGKQMQQSLDPLQGWFGPGRPVQPVAPETRGRAFDYATGYNLTSKPRAHEPVTFEVLRGLADNFDLLRLVIETRKDQMSKLRWGAQYRKPFGGQIRPKADAVCEEIEKFFRSPDKEHTWATWMRLLLEEIFVIDAPAIYLRPDRGGGVYGAEILDGATIRRIIDETGRTPLPPAPAYQQVLKGLPASEFTREELIYRPRNPRAHKLYGLSPVEQVITTVNIAIRRQISQLSFFTEGNIPEAIIGVPPEWTPDQIRDFQMYWDTLLEGNIAQRRHAKFVPGGIAVQFTRSEQGLLDQFDEWLARIICYCFSLPPLPFVKMQNRSTAETAYDSAIEDGLQPLMEWVKDLMDELIRRIFKRDDIEFVWEDFRQLKPLEQANLDLLYVQHGAKSLDEWRISLGADPVGIGPALYGQGPMGMIFLEDIARAKASGQSSLPMPDPMMGGDPSMMGGDPLAGIPPEAAEAAGIEGDEDDSFDPPEMLPDEAEARARGLARAADRARRAKVHPKVAAVLRDAERRLHGPDYP